ncbi:MAG: antibiotic biosynthesis monooxygenase [Rhodocyclales bacterium]|nr:antibiotic biosynthesis monooxygenase [Rhodocyclales bacterium]
MVQEPVFRIVRRQAKAGCGPAYEAMIAGMFEDARRFPGYISAALIPPTTPDGPYQINQRFASEADFERWNRSPERLLWLERLATVAEGEPEYRALKGLEVWFAPPETPTAKLPARWRMTLVSWLGIYPTVALLLTYLAPQLDALPALLRIAIVTALVAILMSYLIMPRLTRWLGWWLRR